MATNTNTEATIKKPTEINNPETNEATRTSVPSLILESDRLWVTLHALMTKNNVESRCKEIQNRVIHQRKRCIRLQDHLQEKNISYHTYPIDLNELRVVIGGLPMLTEWTT